jgi:hypothetical protein
LNHARLDVVLVQGAALSVTKRYFLRMAHP